jgi:WD40 repeat protein
MSLRQGLLGLSFAVLLLLPVMPARSDLQPVLQTKAGTETAPTGIDCHGDPLPEGALARMGTVRLRAGESVRGLAFFPDGKTLASGGTTRPPCLWDVASGKLLREIGPTGGNGTVLFGSDAKKILMISGFGVLHDGATGQALPQFKGRPIRPEAALSPDGTTVAAIELGSGLALFELASGKELRRFSGSVQMQRCVTISPDGRTLAATGQFFAEDRSIRLWDMATGKQIKKLSGHEKGVWQLAFSPDSRTIASAGMDGTVLLQDTATGKALRRFDAWDGSVSCVAFSPDGRLIASGAQRAIVRLWDVATGKEVRHWKGEGGRIEAVAFSPDGKTLAWGGGRIQLADLATGQERMPANGHSFQITSLALTPDGKVLTSMGWDGGVRLWETVTGKERAQFAGPRDTVAPRIVSPDGKMVVARNAAESGFEFWDAASGQLLRSVLGPPARALGVAFSADGTTVAAVSSDKTIRIWEVATGRELQTIKGSARYPLALSPDGSVLAAAGVNNALSLWDVTSGRSIQSLPASGGPFALTFSPDGSLLACWGFREGVRVWKVASGKEVCRCEPLPVSLLGQTLTFAPDGKTLAGGDRRSLAGGDYQTTVYLWETATGQLLRRFTGHHSGVMALIFGGDGRTLISGSGDTTALVWDVTGRVRNGRWQGVHLSGEELQACWANLASVAAAEAHATLWKLVAASGQAVALLKDHVRPMPRLDPARASQLVADLNSDKFAVRQKAKAELEGLGDQAEPALREAVAAKLPLESERRVQALLTRLEGWPAEALRIRRALMVLEYIGTPKARQVLETLARGAPRARLTREAQASLDRVAKRLAATP